MKEVKSRLRLINSVVDGIVIIILNVIALYICEKVLAVGENTRVYSNSTIDTLTTVLFCIITFFYYLILEYSFGETIGKLITKTKVVDEFGNAPSGGLIIIRTLCRFVPLFDALSFLHETKTGLHDRLSVTRVVMKKPIEQ